MPEAHSLFSASGADGWMVCRGKILMETGRRQSSEFADEGTAAHTLADMVMLRRLAGEDVSAQAYIGRKIDVKRDEGGKRSFTVDEDFAEHVDTYINDALAAAEGADVLRFSEQTVHYSDFLGVKPALAFGTSDFTAILMNAPAIIWNGEHFPAGVEAQIHDLKFGRGVRVFADGAQMKHYGLGLLQDFEFVADITRVRMVIHQPRLDHTDEVVMSVKDLRAWAAEPRAAAQAILPLMDAIKPPKGGYQKPQDVPDSLRKHLKPSNKGCRFCDAKVICPALIGEVSSAVSGGRSSVDDFMNLVVDTPADVSRYGDNWLAIFASSLEKIDVLTKAVRAELDRRMLGKGMKVPGFKVVQGSKGDRTWVDSAKAEANLKALRIGEAAYKKKLISPTQAEKLLAKQAPESWTALQPLIYRPDGKPAVVPDTDAREAYTGNRASADDFQDLAPTPGAGSAHPFR